MNQNTDAIIKSKVVLNIIIPMLLGFIFYYIFCPRVWFVRQIDHLFHIGFHLSMKDVSFPELFMLIRYFFLDLLWVYALEYMLFYFLMYEKNSVLISAIIALILAVVVEALQFIGIFDGTFDVVDIIVECCGCVLASLNLYKLNRRMV